MKNMMNLPALLTANGMPMSERLSEALTMVVIGMVMVFSVLAIIMAVLMIMERVFAGKAKGTGTSKKVEKPAPKAESAPAPMVQSSAQDDGAVIAAITAAISAMLAAESGDATYQGGFRVVSFKRSNRGTPWNSVR